MISLTTTKQLHSKLKIKTNYALWVKRLKLEPNQYNIIFNKATSGQICKDYIISDTTAKKIALKQVKYFNQEVIDYYTSKDIFNTTIPVKELANEINKANGSAFSEISLFRLLRDLQFLKQSKNVNIHNDAYDQFVASGLFINLHWVESHKCINYNFHQTRVTRYGIQYFIKSFKNLTNSGFKLAYP